MTETTQLKYEFVEGDEIIIAPGRTVKRIQALVAITLFGVLPGDLGGYIESTHNLEQVSGNAWVYGDAQVYGNARVSGDAWVYGNARVYGDARVSGNAWVYGNARVSGDAQVYGNAWVYGNAQVYGEVSKTPVNIVGLNWDITIEDYNINIGCQKHSAVKWKNFTDNEISQMDEYALDFWNQNKTIILTLAENHGCFNTTESE